MTLACSPTPSPRCRPQLPAVGCSISAPLLCQPFLVCFLFYRNLFPSFEVSGGCSFLFSHVSNALCFYFSFCLKWSLEGAEGQGLF